MVMLVVFTSSMLAVCKCNHAAAMAVAVNETSEKHACCKDQSSKKNSEDSNHSKDETGCCETQLIEFNSQAKQGVLSFEMNPSLFVAVIPHHLRLHIISTNFNALLHPLTKEKWRTPLGSDILISVQRFQI